jgi:hypothetical protein
MKKIYILYILLSLSVYTVIAQEIDGYVWLDPLESINKVEGQGWSNIDYSRLPNEAESTVRSPVWSLSRHSARLSIRYLTNAESIKVNYEVDGNIAMNHMPATGVSGLDLYGKNGNGKWLWYRGLNTFKDTIQFRYTTGESPSSGREYQLYFPLYNNCKNLIIGVPKGRAITFLPQRKEKPIVIYGTSIAQGACASRPGMAWTSILGRKLDYPIVNLGFSGNGRLEKEVLTYVTDIDAEIYVLDCLPNLSPSEVYTEEEIKKRLRFSIRHIRDKRPSAKILLTHHAGYSDGEVDGKRKSVYKMLNSWTNEVFIELQRGGAKNIFILSKSEINLSNDAFVDGTHPTDLGMEQYAKAYEKKILSLRSKE